IKEHCAIVRFGLDNNHFYKGEGDIENAREIVSAIDYMSRKKEKGDRRDEIYKGIRENKAVRWACDTLIKLSKQRAIDQSRIHNARCYWGKNVEKHGYKLEELNTAQTMADKLEVVKKYRQERS